jgi:hypothetical protein
VGRLGDLVSEVALDQLAGRTRELAAELVEEARQEGLEVAILRRVQRQFALTEFAGFPALIEGVGQETTPSRASLMNAVVSMQ